MTAEPLTPTGLQLFIAQFTGPKGEDAFGEWVIDEAHHAGWLAHHVRGSWSRGRFQTAVSGDKGFPDFVLARNGRIIFAELKTEHGKLSPEQGAWMQELGDLALVMVWRPSMRDRILEILE